jgi:acetyl-CoA C-acetyltransferase
MSAAAAQAAGIPTELWVFPHAGADGKDPFMSQRASFTTSPAMRHAGAAVLALANISIDEIAHVDVYSCFPSAVQIACKELGLPLDRQLTVYGGLCFAGGPWNNPVGHAIASMVTVLRGDPGSTGLVTANGGNLQKQSYGIYSTTPPAQGFRTARPQSLIETDPTVDVARGYEGPATIETWTVMHERDGLPARAHLAFRTPDQRRGWAVSSDAGIMATLLAEDVTGTTITVSSGSEFDLP